MSTAEMGKGFFKSLFDWNFTSFITLKFLKVIYIVMTVLVLLGGFILFVSLMASGEAGGIIVALILVPLGTLFYLTMARIYLELIALFFRIGQNTSGIHNLLLARQGGDGGTPPTPPAGDPNGPGVNPF